MQTRLRKVYFLLLPPRTPAFFSDKGEWVGFARALSLLREAVVRFMGPQPQGVASGLREEMGREGGLARS